MKLVVQASNKYLTPRINTPGPLVLLTQPLKRGLNSTSPFSIILYSAVWLPHLLFGMTVN